MSDLTLSQGWNPLKLDVNPYYEGYTFLKIYFFLNYWYIIEDIPFPVIIFFFLLATADSWTTFFPSSVDTPCSGFNH